MTFRCILPLGFCEATKKKGGAVHRTAAGDLVIWGVSGSLIVAIAAAIVATVLSILIYRWQKARKRISWQLTANSRLLTVSEELNQKLEVRYEGIPVKDVSVLLIRISNTGNQPVTASDVERPISISTGVTSKILSAAVVEVEPPSLRPTIVLLENSVSIEPFLLNVQDSITLKLITADLDEVTLDGRIAGVSKFHRNDHPDAVRRRRFAIAGLSLTALGGGVLYFGLIDARPVAPPPMTLTAKAGLTVLIFGYITMFASTSQGLIKRLRRLYFP